MTPEEHLAFLREYLSRELKETLPSIAYDYGTIMAVDGNGFAKILRVGEDFPDSTYYPTVGPWTPEVGQRVLCAKTMGGLIIVGPLRIPFSGGGTAPNGVDGVTNWRFRTGASGIYFIGTETTKVVGSIDHGGVFMGFGNLGFDANSPTPNYGIDNKPVVILSRDSTTSSLKSGTSPLEERMKRLIVEEVRTDGFWWNLLKEAEATTTFASSTTIQWIAIGLAEGKWA